MSLSMFTVVVDCANPYRVAEFWSEALGWAMYERNTDELQLGESRRCLDVAVLHEGAGAEGWEEQASSGPARPRAYGT
jgi:hypothetical protein